MWMMRELSSKVWQGTEIWSALELALNVLEEN